MDDGDHVGAGSGGAGRATLFVGTDCRAVLRHQLARRVHLPRVAADLSAGAVSLRLADARTLLQFINIERRVMYAHGHGGKG